MNPVISRSVLHHWDCNEGRDPRIDKGYIRVLCLVVFGHGVDDIVAFHVTQTANRRFHVMQRENGLIELEVLVEQIRVIALIVYGLETAATGGLFCQTHRECPDLLRAYRFPHCIQTALLRRSPEAESRSGCCFRLQFRRSR